MCLMNRDCDLHNERLMIRAEQGWTIASGCFCKTNTHNAVRRCFRLSESRACHLLRMSSISRTTLWARTHCLSIFEEPDKLSRPFGLSCAHRMLFGEAGNVFSRRQLHHCTSPPGPLSPLSSSRELLPLFWPWLLSPCHCAYSGELLFPLAHLTSRLRLLARRIYGPMPKSAIPSFVIQARSYIKQGNSYGWDVCAGWKSDPC
jgi:hypothetical protein